MTEATGGLDDWPKFDVVIGNPPYQAEAEGSATQGMPIYDRFMDAAYEISEQAVLITPARFLSNAGYTPKAWNAKMLADEHLRVAHFEPDSGALFPTLSDTIKGGIVVTHRHSKQVLGPVGTFTRHTSLNTILHKVEATQAVSLTAAGITNHRMTAYTDRMHADFPDAAAAIGGSERYKIGTNAFEQQPFLFHATPPPDGHEYVQLYGLFRTRRTFRFIRRDYITGPDSFDKWKVAVAAANGTGSTTDFFGIPFTNPVVLGPGVGVTQTFITIGSFDSEPEASACLQYVKSKFARAMLGILKVTQHNPRAVWRYVPLQDFTTGSDIDWSKSISEIDRQLYAKYGLDVDEVVFVESRVKEMQ